MKRADNGVSYPYHVEENEIIVEKDGGNLVIPYTYEGDVFQLNTSEFLTLDEIDAGLQGRWKLRKSEYILGITTNSEDQILISDGKFKHESASAALNGGPGQYYYGPFEVTYKLNLGGFDSDVDYTNEFYFNIINGEPILFHYDDMCERTEGDLPGENGYSF